MRNSLLLFIAWRNFTDKKLRSSLTVLGVTIGVAAIFFLLSFGQGVQQLVTVQVVGDKSLKTIDVTSPNSKIISLNEDAVTAMKAYPHVLSVGNEYSFPGILSYKNGETDAVVYGLDIVYQSLSSLNLKQGRLLEAADTRSVVVNTSALKAFGIDSPKDAINQTVQITVPLKYTGAEKQLVSDTFTIVGVIDSGSGTELFIPKSIFGDAGVPVYSQAKVVIDTLPNVATARTQIESVGFQTSSLTDTLTEIDNIFKFFNIILVGFGSIGMIVAILGMFNTLTISLLERTQEIGLMIAIGARRKDMRKLFIFESILISTIGAALGITIAYIAGRIVNIYVNLGASARGIEQSFDLFVTTPLTVGAVILGTIVVGLLVVHFPARRAQRINPIDALRRE